MTDLEATTIDFLTAAYARLTDEEKDNVHGNHRDETGQELPYWRHGATAREIAVAIVTECQDWNAEDLGINGPNDAYNFWTGYTDDGDDE